MPQIIPLVVTAITAVTSAVVAAGPLAVAAFNAANIIGAAALANEAFKAVQPQVKSSSTAIEWNADPNAPNRFAFGRIGGAGNIIHNATYGPDKMYVGFVGVMSASGPIKSWVAFKADDAFVSFNGSGMATNTEYAGEMNLVRQRGLQPEASYLPSPAGQKNGAVMPRWGASYKLSGKAAYHYTLAENSKRSAFRGKVPTGIHYIEGIYCYDPRFDSTFAGGIGPCRLDDPTTWVYSTNAYIHGLNWAIGRWEGEARGFTPKRYGVPYASMKVGGIGAAPDAIDFAGYVEAANVFDENAWACAAWPDADQGKGAVLDSFLQAGGGIYAERQGKISCLHRAAPRSSIVTITADDTAGTIEYDTTTSLLERINTIRPEYWSEAHGWQMVATDEVTSSVWREEDGQGVEVTRSKGLAYNYVPGSKQARELAALQIAHTREGIRGTAPLRHYLDLEVGDCFTFEVPEAVLNGLKCIVLNVDPDLENDIINVTFASESDGKYPFAFGQAAAPPPAPGLQPADNTVSPPLPGDWTITPRPPTGGSLLPGFDLSGAVGNSTATAIEVEYWEVPAVVDPNDAPPEDAFWKSAGTWPPTASTIPIDVQADRYYWIGLTYIRAQNYSARTVTGPYLAGQLIAGDVSPVAPTIIGLQDQITTAFGDIFDVSGLLADARADIDAQGVEIAAARGGQPNLNSRIVQVNQARIDGDEANAQAISLVQARTANTEADIIDIENAQANDRTATAQAIQQVTAQVAGAALNKNSTYAIWPLGQSTPDNIGSFGSGLTVSRGAGKVSPNAITLEAAAGSSNNGVEVAWTASNWNGRMPVVAGAPAYWIIDYKIEIGTGGLNGPMLRFLLTNAATGTSLSNTIQKPLSELHTSTGDGQIIEGAYFFRCDLPSGSPAASARLALFTRAGAVANLNRIIAHKLAVRPATSAEISAQVALPATQSTVTSHSLAIIDLENQQALASYEVLANASGGLPAFLRLISSTAGGYAALAAPVVALMNTIVGGDPLVAMEARAGEVFFSRPIYIAVPGTSYHLIVGGGGVSGQQWLLWFGPNSTSAALATRTNGAMALGSDGVVYLGDAALGGSPKSATMPFSGNAGYSSGGVPQNIAGTTSPLTVPQSGKFVVDVSNVFVLSEGNGSSKLAIGSLALQIGKNGVYTTIASGISASTSNDIDPGAPVNASAMNLTVVHNFAGPVTFRVLAAGGGTSTQSRSVISGSLKATWYPT